MGIKSVDSGLLKKMIVAGAGELEKNKQMLDALNVFPVPDGDTGTNMSLTVLAAAKEVSQANGNSVGEIAKIASNGTLRGARGNSGVILSQLFRGFAKGLEGKKVATTEDLANGLVRGAETAYKAVMKPREGTILTIARELGEKARECAMDTDDIEEFINVVIAHGNGVLRQTTQMLPELRQAGVVDAGGKGLLLFLEGACRSLHSDFETNVTIEPVMPSPTVAVNFETDIRFGYCTEFLIDVERETSETEAGLKAYLDTLGDSIVVVCDDAIIKVHVHTNHPGLILEYALKIGSLSNLKIENMRQQHSNMFFAEMAEEQEAEPEAPKEYGFVAVSMGEGLKELFKSLGADFVIEGGQTMNPSTEDILEAVKKVNAEHVFVLPNNKNITLAAQQAVELCSDKKIHVIPTKTIPQGVTALINFVPTVETDENLSRMHEAIGLVKTGQVTYAVRDTVIHEQDVKQGDILCLREGNIEIVSQDLAEGTKQLIDLLVSEDNSVLCLYYGADTDEDAAAALIAYVTETYPDIETEIYDGGQPLYYYILSVE